MKKGIKITDKIDIHGIGYLTRDHPYSQVRRISKRGYNKGSEYYTWIRKIGKSLKRKMRKQRGK